MNMLEQSKQLLKQAVAVNSEPQELIYSQPLHTNQAVHTTAPTQGPGASGAVQSGQ